MFDFYYKALKQHLVGKVTDLEGIDWYLDQFFQEDDTHIRRTPLLLIRFLPVRWDTYPINIQKAELELEIYLISSTQYGDERDMLDTNYINHLEIERKIFKALMNARFSLSQVPGMEDMAGTENDAIIMESLVRTASDPHHTLDNLIVTSQTFKTLITDYTALPQWDEIVANLECTIEID